MASSASSTIDPTVQRITQEYPTLKKHLDEHGYVVVRNVISPQQAAEFAQKFWDWVEALPKDKVKHKIDRNDPATWGNLMHSLGGIIKHYGIGHTQMMWNLRAEPGVAAFYELYWGTKDLLTSFDGANLTIPSEPSKANKWNMHTDQGPCQERPIECLQAIVNLLPCGENDGGLRVLPGSHKKHAEFFKNKGTMTADEARKYDVKGAPKTAADAENCTETFHWTQARSNWYVLDLKNSYDAKFVSQYSVDSNGHRGVKVCVEPGDMVFFHSRLFHQAWGIDNTKNTNPLAHRMVAYISMQPRSMATAKEIETRKKYAAACRTTSHWSALALSVNAEKPRIYGPADRHWIEDYNMQPARPQLTERMKQLIGYLPGEELIPWNEDGKLSGKKRAAPLTTTSDGQQTSIQKFVKKQKL